MYLGTHSDAVVAAAVGLVNAATPGFREGRPYAPADRAPLHAVIDDTLRTERRTSPIPLSAIDGLVGVAWRVREVIEAVDAGDQDRAAGLINAMLLDSAARPYLIRHDDEPWHLHFHGPGGDGTDSLVKGWLAGLSTGLALVLGSEYADRLGVCSAPACDRAFVDVSRNGSRRFCGSPCQSRVKTAAYRARRTDS